MASLQSHLDAPAPRLLASFASLGTCLVSVVDDGEPGAVADIDSTGSDRPTADDSDPPTTADDHSTTGDNPPTADDTPVGYVLLIGGDDVHLAELVVHPAHRREGRGRALLRAAIDRQEPGTRVTLAVAADNGPARSLYESVGFRRIDYRASFYEEGVEGSRDAVVYAYDVASGS
nr:GNAT family N-acetyltransferase [Halobellus rarus]